jgi:hypothetical protein
MAFGTLGWSRMGLFAVVLAVVGLALACPGCVGDSNTLPNPSADAAVTADAEGGATPDGSNPEARWDQAHWDEATWK